MPGPRIDVDLTLSDDETPAEPPASSQEPVPELEPEPFFPSLQPMAGQTAKRCCPANVTSKAQTHLDLLPAEKPMAIVGEDDYTKRK